MPPRSSKSGRPFWPGAAAVLLAGLAAHNVWRASAAAVTVDEAFTANAFADVAWSKLLLSYDANHHVLHSILVKLSFAVFGVSELALRLPAVAAGLACLAALFILARRMFGDTAPLFIAACGTACHPVLADFFSLARGYGLAVLFLTLALIPLTKLLVLEEQTGARELTAASLCLGLAVASNLVFAVPAAAAILAAALLRRQWRLLETLAVPGAAVAFLLLALPLSRSNGSYFYYGENNVRLAARSVLETPGWERFNAAAPYAAAALLLAALVLSARGRRLRFFAWTLALSCAGIGALKLAAGLPMPRGRTGVYLLPLLFFLLAQVIERTRARPLIAVPATALAALLPFVFLSTLPGARFLEWEADRANRRLFAELAQHAGRLSNPAVRASWPYNFGLEFYRRASRTTRFGPIGTLLPGRSGQANLFVLAPTEPPNLRPPAAETVFTDPETQVEILVLRR
jgi:4-amino-4-deoxy-L-arabinose transferase-like glycosyltransferase